MTPLQRSLFPASGDDGRTLLGALEVVASRRLQLREVVRTVVGQRMSLEPRPQIFHGIGLRRVRRQERELDGPVEGVPVVANDAAVVCAGTVPDHQQGLLQVILEGLEQFDPLLPLDAAALVKPEQAMGACQSSDG